jgi:serine/threonine protein kinase
VKPENIMVMGPVPAANVKVDATAAKLLDFGAAKRLDRLDDDGNQKRTFVGTPQYAPPEQWKAEIVPASDLYALGGSMFFMLTGRFPYQKDRRDPQAYRDSHINDPILEVRDFNDTVPLEVSRVMRKMMAKAAADRGTAEELIAALKDALPKDSLSTPTPPTRSPAPSSKHRMPAAPLPAAAAATPVNAEPEEIPNPLYRAADGFLAFCERLFIPGFYRPPPGDEASIPERIASLLRRPMVLLLLGIVIALFIAGISLTGGEAPPHEQPVEGE